LTKVAGLLFFLAAATAALFLFHIKQEVRELEEELGIVHRDILRHQEAVQVLKTEWSYLNQPARIADLAGRHLGLQPLTARQFVRLDDLPRRRSDLLTKAGNRP
jgi:cell division protein FtsL